MRAKEKLKALLLRSSDLPLVRAHECEETLHKSKGGSHLQKDKLRSDFFKLESELGLIFVTCIGSFQGAVGSGLPGARRRGG